MSFDFLNVPLSNDENCGWRTDREKHDREISWCSRKWWEVFCRKPVPAWDRIMSALPTCCSLWWNKSKWVACGLSKPTCIVCELLLVISDPVSWQCQEEGLKSTLNYPFVNEAFCFKLLKGKNTRWVRERWTWAPGGCTSLDESRSEELLARELWNLWREDIDCRWKRLGKRQGARTATGGSGFVPLPSLLCWLECLCGHGGNGLGSSGWRGADPG